MTSEQPTKIQGEGRQGDFVHATQKMGKDAGFRNVSQIWLDKGCFSYDNIYSKIYEGHKQIQDFRIPLNSISPIIDEDNSLKFQHEGMKFVPTRYALGQIAAIVGLNQMTLEILAGHRTDLNYNCRNRQVDREALISILNAGFKLIDHNKQYLIRTQKDGTLRGWLSSKYKIMDNRLLMDVIRKIIPDGLVSHWKDDGDYSNVWGNVLIPDTLRQESDSEYGAMYSISNSEIGRRKFGAVPSLFRAICMNGCIWDQKRGKGYYKTHRGSEIDMFSLQSEMRKHLHAQIPLINSSIDDLLNTRNIGWDGASVKPVFAALANEFGLSKLTATDILQAWRKQSADEDAFKDKNLQRSAFAVINAITRSGGEANNPQEWVDRDTLGGRLLDWKPDKWKGLFNASKHIGVDEVNKMFRVTAH